MPDGYITYSTKLDNKQMEKDLAKATKEVDKIEGQMQKHADKRLPLVEQAAELGVKLDEAKAKLSALQDESQRVAAAISGATANDPASVAAYAEAAGRRPALEKELVAAQKAVDGLQAKFDKADTKLQASTQEAKRLEDRLSAAKEKAGAIADKLSKGTTAGEKMGQAMAHAETQVGKFTHRLASLAKRVFVFTLITQALRAIRDYMGKYVSANTEATQAIAKLKGALLTLAQPLLSVIIPALTVLVNLLTRVVSAAASLMSLLFGKGIKQTKQAAKAMYDEAKAIEAAGAAADKAAGSLASFDEINKLSDNSAAASTIAPDFDFDTSTTEADMEKILNWVKLIGAGLLAWKLSDTFLGGMTTFVGLIIAINGALELAQGAWDAWQNGMEGSNLLQMLGGALLLAGGLYIAFGKVGGGIGLLVGGLVILATSIHDAMENGWNFHNLLGSIAGLLLSGLGIGLLTGSWIPLLIAGIASALLALTVATGQGEELLGGIRQVCEGFVEFIAGIFTGDIDRALSGVSGIFSGLGAAVDAVVLALQDSILNFLDWLDQKTGGRFHQTIEDWKRYVVDFFTVCRETLGGLLDACKQIFSGIVKFVTGVFTNDWDMAWEGVKDIFKGVINGIISIFEGMINSVIGGLNIIIRGFKNFTAFKLPDWLGGYSFSGINIPEIPRAKIPRLATGAVVPPNREFLAMLGDNKHETEVVSPLSTMKQAMLEALREYGGVGGGGTYKFELYVNGRKMAVEMVKEINDMTRESGKPVVLF